MYVGLRILSAALLLVVAGMEWGEPTSVGGSSFCQGGGAPEFHLGFAALSAQLGPAMGSAVECEHPVSANGDTIQATTRGIARYHQTTNLVEFRTATDRWLSYPDALVHLSGPTASDEPSPLTLGASPSALQQAGAGVGSTLAGLRDRSSYTSEQVAEAALDQVPFGHLEKAGLLAAAAGLEGKVQ